MPIATTTARMPHPSLRPCPACGQLECLCRPRFFAGQLLTEEDLNRLDHYIVEKNRLHNRYLHGWGVACGLEVLCHPCEGYVTVTPGYALSPCGADIVVCQEEAVDVCALLRQCREETRRHWECDPAWPRPDPNCEEEQSWVLYICYDEKPARGVTALRGGSGPACCSRCSCGGASGCGCGCHATSGRPTRDSYQTRRSTHARPARALPQCEPTVTCEGYTFQIRQEPPRPRNQEPDPGKLFHRIADCLTELVELRRAMDGLGTAPQLSTVQAIRQTLAAVLEQHGMHHCDLYKRVLQPLQFQPGRAAGTIDNANNQVGAYFTPLLNEAAQDCICSALLPPCPEPVEDNCVPLATLTVNCQSGCRIVRVCNWKKRQMVPTVPGLAYWFGGFLRTAGVAEFLAELCCGPIERGTPAFAGATIMTGNADAKSIFDVFKTQLHQFLKKLLPQ